MAATPSRRSFCKSVALASLGSLMRVKPVRGQAARPVRSKRDLMHQVLDLSTPPSYVPAGFFMHFGVRGDAAVRAHLDYFRATGMDFVKIQFDEQSLPANSEIKTPEDWAKLPVLGEEWFEPSLYLLKRLIAEAKAEAFIIQTVYSPYQMAKQAVPWRLLVEHVNQDAEQVCRGMENITLSLLNFVQAASRLGVDGVYMCSQGGETNRIANLTLFDRTIKTYDMLLYKEASRLAPCNIMHLCDYDGPYEEFAKRFHDYPGQVVNVPLSADDRPLSLREAAQLFKRPVMGGIDRHGILATGTTEQVKQMTLAVLKEAPANFILGADCTVSPKTSIENLQTAIRTAHEYRS